MQSIQPIRTSSLTLHEFTEADVRKLYTMSLEPCMRSWIPDQVYRDEEQASEVLSFLIAQYAELRSPVEAPCVLGVRRADSGKLIGHVGLSPLCGEAEIGYAIEGEEQGQGFATEAVTVMVRWGHQTFGLPRVLGIAAGGNVASCRVLEKSGFTLVEAKPGSLHGWHGVIRTYESLSEEQRA